MSAAVEVHGNKAAFASRRVPAWHNLGVVFTEEKTPREMLAEAHMLDWNVRGIPMEDVMPPGVSSDLGQIVIIRDNPWYDETEAIVEGENYTIPQFNHLGTTGKDYSITQNEDLADFSQYLLEGSRGETAGSLKGGQRVFMTLALETETVIDPLGAADTVKQYLMLYNSHNGSSALIAGVTPVRVVCQNTLNMALSDMPNKVKIRHTKSMQSRMEDAKKTLNLTANYIESFETMATNLYEAPVSDDEFMKIIKAAYPEPDKDANKASITRWNAKADDLMQLWSGETQANIAGTGWAALNALTENQQWNRSVYKEDTQKFFAAGAGLDEAVNKERNRLALIVNDLVLA